MAQSLAKLDGELCSNTLQDKGIGFCVVCVVATFNSFSRIKLKMSILNQLSVGISLASKHSANVNA
jgi:hypothetical protein